MTSIIFPAIGTQWQIDISTPISPRIEATIKGKVFDKIKEFDASFSRFKEKSWVTKHSNFIGTTTLPQDLLPLLNIYKQLNEITNGAFTPLIGRTMIEAGYDAEYSLKEKPLSKLPELTSAIDWDDEKIEFKEKVFLDFGAAGKGYLVDLISNIFEKFKVYDYCIDASGDMLYKTTKDKSIRVGLEHPDDKTIAIGVCELKNKSICGSAGNRRRWASYHHTINPLTLRSPDDIKATWVVANTTMLADALTTCLFLDPHPEKYKDFQFEFVLLYKDNTALRSTNFPGQLFT